MTCSDQICRELTKVRFRFGSEADLQQGISQILTGIGITHSREVRLVNDKLSPRIIRLDFLCSDGLAIEVKLASNKSPSALYRQLDRYAVEPSVKELLVVTDGLISDIPETLHGKTISTHFLIGSAF